MAARTGASRHTGGTGGGGRFVVAWRAAGPYRPLLVLMLVSSTASFAALGALSLFARDELGASDIMVTVNFIVVALAGTVAMLVTGPVSDRRGVRPVLVAGGLGWLSVG